MIKISFSALLFSMTAFNTVCSEQDQERQKALNYLHKAFDGMNTELLVDFASTIEAEREIGKWQNPQEARIILVDKNWKRNRAMIMKNKQNIFKN
jgi:hypothetical protein